jgi:xanthine dehydrogenase small subunit
MNTAISALHLKRAHTLGEALLLMRDEERVPIAGATDLYVSLNFGTLAPRRFVDIWGLRELREIAIRADRLVLGGLVTYTQMIESPVVNGWLPMLVEAARQVGGVQIQNRGTIGGNIANGSPAGDSLPVLAAANAELVLRNVDGERRVPFASFYTGYRANVLSGDELIVSVEIPRVFGAQWFRKVGTRAAQAISKVVVAAVHGAEPLHSGAGIDAAIVALRNEVHPIDDVRSTAEYRLRVTENLVRRFWSDTG